MKRKREGRKKKQEIEVGNELRAEEFKFRVRSWQTRHA
jgi:hypothetical protein